MTKNTDTKTLREGSKAATLLEMLQEALDQAFNTLDAQREACEAYILSQAGEAGNAFPTAMTTAAGQAAIWIALLSKPCSLISRADGSIL